MNWQKDLIGYRRRKASEALEDAGALIERKSLSAAVNRIYYALFYEVSALLLTQNLSSAKHTGIRRLFSQHFIKPGIVNAQVGKFFSRMFDFRQKGDYADFVYFEENEVKEWHKKAEEYIAVIEELTNLNSKA